MEKIEVVVSERFSGLAVDELLKSWLLPRKERYLLASEKRLTLNGRLPNFADKVLPGDQVVIYYAESRFSLALGEPGEVSALYENENLIVVNKPAGLKTHGNEPGEVALQNHVAAYLGKGVYVVHRLDRETSGAVIFAKNSFVLPILSQLLEEKKIHREYLALVQGNLAQPSLTIDKNIGRDRHDRSKRCLSAKGQEAITQIERIKNFANSALVRCRLLTGRTHQIRVHLVSIGHPIISDPLYNPAKTSGRMMLHANKLVLTQPFTFETKEVLAKSQSFEAGIPESD